MPHKKRSHAHGHHKKSQERTASSTTLGEQQVDDRPYNTQAAAASKAQSQPRQYSPTSVAQVAVNPAQFESASAASTMATKPGAVSVTMGGATASDATAGGSPTTAGTTQRGTAKVAMPETAFVSPAGATIIDIPTPGTKGSPKDTPKPAPMHPAKATPLTTGGGNIVGEAATPWKAEVPKLQESPKQTAKSVPTTSSKVDMAKKDPAKLVTAVAAQAAAAGDASMKGPQTKVQVEVVPPGAKAAKEPAPMHPAKATPLTTGGGNIVGEVTTPWKAEVPKLQESPEQTAKSVPTTSSKVDMAKKDPAKLVTAVAAQAAAAGDASMKGPQTKVQVEVVPPGAKAAKEPAPMHPAKATPLTTGGGNIVGEVTTPWKAEVPKLQESPEQTAKSVPTTSSKVDMAKKDPAKLVTAVAAPAAAAGDASLKGPQTKVQVEVVPPGAKAAKEELAVDPFDALADSLPSSESFAPAAHVYTGPEVIEHGLSSKKGVICGGNDCPLPPGYRFEDMAPVADVKPKDVPKPMSTDEALDSLSFGFTTSMPPIPQKQEKKVEDLAAIDALSAGFSNFAPLPPAPIKKAEEFKSAPVTKSPAPPVDKKANVEKFADDFSLMSGLDSPLATKPKTDESVATTSSKVDMAKKDPAKLVTAVAAPAAAAGDASLKGPQTKKVEDLAAVDALSAGFSNFAPPPPAPIKKAEEFKSAPVTKCPAPPVDKKANVEKKPMSTDEALDSLSFGFTTSMPPIPQKQEKKVEDLAAIDAISAGFSNFSPPPPAPIKVQVEVVPPGAKAAKEPAPMHPAKATPLTTGGGNIVVEAATPWKAEVPKLQESPEQTAKSVPTTSSKVDMAKKDPAKLVTAVAAPAAAAGDASLKGPQTKVQVEVVPPGAKAAKEPAPMHPAKATPLTTGGGNIVVEAATPWKAEVPKLQESPKQTAMSVPTTSSKVDMAKKDPAKLVTAVAAPAAAAGDASLKGPQTKVQVEVVPPGAKAAKEELAVDPFDALADSLPSSESFAPAAHVYTGPEVIEHGLSSKKGVICGGNDCPLPPGYRFEDMSPVADVKPKDVPKPMSTDEALDSLSFGFTTSMPPIPQKQEKSVPTTSSKVDMAKKDPAKLVMAVAAPAAAAGDASLKGPQTKLVTAVAAPAAAAGDASLKGPQTKVQVEVVPPGAKAAKEPAPMHPAKATPLTTGGGNIVVEAATPWKAEVPKLQESPEQTAKSVPTTSSKVDMAKKDPAKLVTAVAAPAAAAGDASLKGPQTKKVEDLAAVDALSAGFSNFAPPPPAPIKKAEEFKSAPVTKCPAPPVDKKANVEKFAVFSLMSGLDSPLATKPKTDGGGSMSLDALSALRDSLPAPEPAPEPPKIRHEDIVTEGKLTSKKGVFVGERDDTLPPKYRFTENKVKDLPPLKPEPSMDSGEALEILSGDFMSSCVAPAVHAPVLCPPAPPTQASDDFALDALAGDFVAPAVAPAVKSAVDRQLSRGTVDALDTLSDSLMDKAPIPEPAPVSVRDIVKEKKVIEEKLTKVGERDDSLPAEYRPTEKDRKAMAEAKVQADVRPKQPSMDDSEALDLLSRDLSSSTGPAAASVVVTTEQRQPRLEPMSAPVLDDLAGTLLPDTPEFKSKGDKPKSKSRSKSKKQRKEDPSSIDHLSGQLSSDVVSASTNKDGKS
ncbi:calpastatin isoform X9 [Oncorhynchus keta]|uniref:calpastatin isoform X9 n=1 Tax=Oncorhynchus keta TaxID=8018 RepID=UPI00227A81F7|nr:calpastatin isoform X9 [Oncorhynchus keta]